MLRLEVGAQTAVSHSFFLRHRPLYAGDPISNAAKWIAGTSRAMTTIGIIPGAKPV
jgi:hypothetical protein